MGEKNLDRVSLPNCSNKDWVKNVDWQQICKVIQNAVSEIVNEQEEYLYEQLLHKRRQHTCRQRSIQQYIIANNIM